jgi:hypothetical protein
MSVSPSTLEQAPNCQPLTAAEGAAKFTKRKCSDARRAVQRA